MAKSETSTAPQKYPRFHVLIAAAGTGARMGSDTPKQYLPLCGQPILRRTIKTFQSCPGLGTLRVIINPDDADLYHDTVKGLDLPNFIEGGKERKNSIFNGLKSFSKARNDDCILIHDAARPFVRREDIENLVLEVQKHKAACLAVPVSDTLRYTSANDPAQLYVKREELQAMQTPQGFEFELIMEAHTKSDPDVQYTDDSSMVTALGTPVKLVQGHKSNIKITTDDDLKMAEKLLQNSTITLSGIGFDVHAFDAEKSGPVRLCGIDIPHDRALKGHSDADVGLHALTDAILGAIGEGDIGQHFPPSNPEFKDMDSAVFLEKAVQLLTDKAGALNNIDLTLICEEPKIGPHVQAMSERISQITGLSEPRINVKATTTEQLGFTGRKEGIAAQALVTITMPEAPE